MPSAQQVSLADGVTELTGSWALTLTEDADSRLTSLAQRIVDHLAQLRGPRLHVRKLDPATEVRQQVLLIRLGRTPVAPQVDRALGRSGGAEQLLRLLAARDSRLLSRPGAGAAIRKEAYYLSVQPDRIIIASEGVEGLLYGGQTLMQLITIGALERPGRVPHATITDWPLAPLRGYLADVRKPPWGFAAAAFENWKRHLDRLGSMKCSYLLLEQSMAFQYQFAGEPVGLPGGLRVDSARALSEHAASLGIMLIPMIELSRGDSLTRHMAKNPSRHSWMPDHHNKGFCPFNELSYEFIRRMFTELTAAFPYSPYLHVGEDETSLIGGSEVCPRCRQAVARYATESGMAPDPIGYPMAYFQARVSQLAKSHGLQTMVWGTFGFLEDNKSVRQVVARVMPRDVIVWDWMEKGFDKLGYPTWLPYVPSWEWKGPGVREVVTHMIAAKTKPAWDGRDARSAAGREEFSKSWSVATFGVPDPDIGRRCLDLFGHDPYGWEYDPTIPRSRWLRARFGGYLLFKPADFKEPRNRYLTPSSIEQEIASLIDAESFFEGLSKRAPLNQSLASWYFRVLRLSRYGLEYARSVHRAYESVHEASAEMTAAERRNLLDAARRELQTALDRFAGPIAEIAERSRSELGGPILNPPSHPWETEYDVTGSANGVHQALATILERVQRLDSSRPAPPPESLMLFPSLRIA